MPVDGRRRGVKWAFWGFACLIIFSVGALLFKDQQVSRGIRREEALMLAMGVDVRKTNPGSNAASEYKAIAKEIGEVYDQRTMNEAMLTRVEAASKKPLARQEPRDPNPAPNDAIYEWVIAYSWEAARKHDWKTLDRLFDLQVQMRVQLIRGSALGYGIYTDAVPMGSLALQDVAVRRWLRPKLESFDQRVFLQAQLSAVGKMVRRLDGLLPGSSTIIGPSIAESWWHKAVESQTLFRKTAELEILMQWRQVVADALKGPPHQLRSSGWISQVSTRLSLKGSWPATWAADRLAGFDPDQVQDSSWNTTLIRLDLYDQRLLGKSLKPTWSQKYCFDPATGAPIKVVATKEKLKLSSYSGSGGWSSEETW